MNEMIIKKLQDEVTKGLEHDTIHFGDKIPLMHCHGDFSENISSTMDFAELTLTPSYMQDIREHYTKEVMV